MSEREEKGRRAYQVLELPARLLHDAVLSADDDGHSAEVADLGAADDERVDVEPAAGEDPGHAREDTGLVLDEAVEHMPGADAGSRERGRSLFFSLVRAG